jgi:hypothetical protein
VAKQSNSNDSEDQLAEELYAAAVAAAAKHGRTFKASAANGLKELSRMAAEEVLAPSRLGERSKAEAKLTLAVRKDHARKAVLALVESMANHALTVKDYQRDRLGERTLTNAMYFSSFCPCWPFC